MIMIIYYYVNFVCCYCRSLAVHLNIPLCLRFCYQHLSVVTIPECDLCLNWFNFFIFLCNFTGLLKYIFFSSLALPREAGKSICHNGIYSSKVYLMIIVQPTSKVIIHITRAERIWPPSAYVYSNYVP